MEEGHRPYPYVQLHHPLLGPYLGLNSHLHANFKRYSFHLYSEKVDQDSENGVFFMIGMSTCQGFWDCPLRSQEGSCFVGIWDRLRRLVAQTSVVELFMLSYLHYY